VTPGTQGAKIPVVPESAPAITLEMTAEGSVEDYTPDKKDAVAAGMAASLGMPASSIIIDVVPVAQAEKAGWFSTHVKAALWFMNAQPAGGVKIIVTILATEGVDLNAVSSKAGSMDKTALSAAAGVPITSEPKLGGIPAVVPTPKPTPTATPLPKPLIPFSRTAVDDPNPLKSKEGVDVVSLDTCIPMNKPCRLLFMDSDAEEPPYKFWEYKPGQKCCAPFTCQDRDVAALSFYRNDFKSGTVENVGSVAYCTSA